MKKYILKSPSFTGEVVFGYNENDRLVLYENTSDMNAEQIDWMLANLPNTANWIELVSRKIKGTLTLIPADLTFDRFWNTYDHKVNRKRAEPLYKKLNDADKMMAIIKIKSYQSYCITKGRGMADPDTYISKRHFDTDWLNLK